MTTSTPNLKMQLVSSAIFPGDAPEDSGKRFFVCSCDSWESIPNCIEPSSKYFGLLIAAEAASVSNAVIIQVAEATHERGLAYMSAWGSDCAGVEDIFDEVAVGRELDGKVKLGQGDVVMTTSHKNEPLSEAVWFFVNCAWPTKYFASECSDWIVAVVGNVEWESTAREEIVKLLTNTSNPDEA